MEQYLKGWLRAALLTGAAARSMFHLPTEASARQKLIWTVPPLAPAFIGNGPDLKGYAAETQNWFANQLSDYEHVVTQVPLARLLAEMRADDDDLRCSTTLIPTPARKEYIAFAKTVLLHLPVSVVIRSDDLDRFRPFLDDDGNIQLPRLLAHGDLNAALRIGRVYGGVVDGHLGTYRSASQVMQVADDTKLLKLLELDRIDWTLYFPSEAEFYRRQSTPDQTVTTLPIAGNTSLLEATIGCNDTPAGRDVIAKINTIIGANPDMPWTDFYVAWLNPADREWFRIAREHYIHSTQFKASLTTK